MNLAVGPANGLSCRNVLSAISEDGPLVIIADGSICDLVHLFICVFVAENFR
jgi:hypothetical protein